MSDVIHFIEKLYISAHNDRNMIKKLIENEILTPLCIPVQEKIMEVTVENPICHKYPPPHSFKKMFLRVLIEAVECQEEEFSEKLMKEYAETLSVSPEDERKSYKSYRINHNCVISLQENTCFVSNGTTGLQTWEASKYLAEWCINNPSIFADKKILELGSGVGLLGLTILKLCQPKQYIFTDKSWEVLNVLSSNIQINVPDLKSCDIQQIQLVWSTVGENDAKKFSPDILLGADIVFDIAIMESLVQTLKIFLSKESSCAYIASTIRDPNTDKQFLLLLDSVGLTYEVLDTHKKSMFVFNPKLSFVLYKIKCKKISLV